MKSLKDEIIEGVHSGRISNTKLPERLYFKTAERLNSKVDKSFKRSLSNSKFEMLADLHENIYMFSAAKTFQNISEMEDALIGEHGLHLTLSEYRPIAEGIFNRYNDAWLNAEESVASTAGRSAEQWVDITENGSPALIYAVDEETACDICQPCDAIVLPVNDPFWDDNATPQHFNCNCSISEVDSDTLEKIGYSRPDQVEQTVGISQREKNPMFNYNPGKDRVVFKDKGESKHPYFDVPEKYKGFASDNFNLDIPEE